MTYIATAIFSALSIRWPMAGIISFLLAYTGLAGFFEELGILGAAVGAVRPDTVATAVSIVVLLRRPAAIRIPPIVTALLWTITGTVPVAIFFLAKTDYEVFANLWRVFFWAPLFLALTRLSEKEWRLLLDAFIVLFAINGLLLFYIVQSGDYAMYRRLGIQRASVVDYFNSPLAVSRYTLETLRMTLPGTFTFASMPVFLCFIRLLSPQVSKAWRVLYLLLMICILYSVYLTLVRTIAIAVFVGTMVILLLGLALSRAHQKIYATAIILVVCLALSLLAAEHTGATRAWQDRASGSVDIDSVYIRLDNNVKYWDILTQSYAIIGHPGFEAADAAVGGYNDVVAAIAIWWYYGLVAAVCYCCIIAYFAKCGVSAIKSAVSREPLPLFALSGMFIAHIVDNLSGPLPITFDFAFAFSLVLAYSACMIFPKKPTTVSRPKELLWV